MRKATGECWRSAWNWKNLVAERTSELRKVNQELNESIRKLRESRDEVESQALFPKQNPNPVMRVSPDGMIMYANHGSERLLAGLETGGSRRYRNGGWNLCVKQCSPANTCTGILK